MGGSAGGTACMRTAVDAGISSFVAISSPQSIGGTTRLGVSGVQAMAMPKLFVAAEGDVPFVGGMQTLYDVAPDPKQIQIFPGAARGTRLFLDPLADEFTNLLVDFLNASPAAEAPTGQASPRSYLIIRSAIRKVGSSKRSLVNGWSSSRSTRPGVQASMPSLAMWKDVTWRRVLGRARCLKTAI